MEVNEIQFAKWNHGGNVSKLYYTRDVLSFCGFRGRCREANILRTYERKQMRGVSKKSILKWYTALSLEGYSVDKVEELIVGFGWKLPSIEEPKGPVEEYKPDNDNSDVVTLESIYNAIEYIEKAVNELKELINKII